MLILSLLLNYIVLLQAVMIFPPMCLVDFDARSNFDAFMVSPVSWLQLWSCNACGAFLWQQLKFMPCVVVEIFEIHLY
jgi:hypothetical protein